MSHPLIYRALVPNAPLHRRTESDDLRQGLLAPQAKLLRQKVVVPGLQEPSLISSFAGSIERILLCFPSWAVQDDDFVKAYQSLIGALRVGTRFIVVHHASIAGEIAPWFFLAGHDQSKVTFISLPDYVTLTDWAEDAYVALLDARDDSRYLMEPWEFRRVGDALIADSVEEFSDIKASQAPLIFQGGNCLVGDDFWLLGKDYFVDSMRLIGGARAPVQVPLGEDTEVFVKGLFASYVDKQRKLVLVGSDDPLGFQSYAGAKAGSSYFLDIVGNGAGTYQPIFHIDMFITLLGKNSTGSFEVLVGSPAMADQLLGTSSPYGLNSVYDDIAASLEQLGVSVIRNPLVHRATLGETFTLMELEDIAAQPGYEELVAAIDELKGLGAAETSKVRIRDWHHITWNNCLVENSQAKGRHVYLPTFGYGRNADLATVDGAMQQLWAGLGFTVHLLGDFNKFAERQGVVHCIKKYLDRGD